MASTFESLPPEIVQKCVEFLDFDLVSTDYGVGPGRERGRWPFFPFCMLSELAKAHDPKISPWELAPLIGIGLEAWADPILAARFTHQYLCFNLRAHSTEIMAKT